MQTRGAALTGLWLRDKPHSLVLRFADGCDHLRVPIYAGVLVGPVANRIRQGKVRIGGCCFQMTCNENGQTALHSGPEGLHVQEWAVLQKSHDVLTLKCLLPDGLGGLPGNREITASYRLAGQTFALTVTATTDATTPINIAAHPYWNLDGLGDIATHRLQVMAGAYLPVHDLNLPTGEIASVSGTWFDFQNARPLTHDPALDVNFCLSRVPQAAPRPAARLLGRDGTTLEIATTAPGLQVYGGAHLPHQPAALETGGDLKPFGAIALEPQFWPDAPAHPEFPSILLNPGQTWRQETVYRLSCGQFPGI